MRIAATDPLGLLAAVWAIPAAILIVGAPIAMAAAMLAAFARWLMQ